MGLPYDMPVIDRERWRVIEPLLDRALSLTPLEQRSLLHELTGHAPDIAAELGELLVEDAAADEHDFLVEPVEVTLSGLRIGPYLLERPIGHGGMGSVWLARRADGQFDGRAAIKLLNLDLLTSAGRVRLQREGSLLARLTHPGIARLLDAGVSAIGQPYLVLEYVDGCPIDTFAAARRLDLEQRVRLFLQVLEAVGHAHDNLVVHQDLKPSNILVANDGTVKLLDFGIATLLDADGRANGSVNGSDLSCALTPEYAAPEQVRGGPITTATDVYTLGALLYLLVRGRRVGTTADALGLSYEVAPAQLGLGDLEIILAKALRRKAVARYQSATAFADDLRRYLRHEPINARRSTMPYRVGKLLRRHRVAAVAVAVTTLTFVAPIAVSLHALRETRRERDAALMALERKIRTEMSSRMSAANVGTCSLSTPEPATWQGRQVPTLARSAHSCGMTLFKSAMQ